MKTIGLIGGLSWQSTAYYYQQINLMINAHLGGLHSAKIHLQSLDFSEISTALNKEEWPIITKALVIAAKKFQSHNADFLMIANNTLHNVADELQQTLDIPLLHIVDVIGEQLKKDNIQCVGLLGTIPTMQLEFYRKRLSENFPINVITPPPEQRKVVHQIIFNELCLGEFIQSSKVRLVSMINQLQRNNAQAIILGCTELPLLIKKSDSCLPIYDSALLHCQAAVNLALNNDSEHSKQKIGSSNVK